MSNDLLITKTSLLVLDGMTVTEVPAPTGIAAARAADILLDALMLPEGSTVAVLPGVMVTNTANGLAFAITSNGATTSAFVGLADLADVVDCLRAAV